MKLKNIHCENFRRFEDFEISFDKDLTVLVARNGAGKSSILDAAAIALAAFLTRLPSVKGFTQKDTDFRVKSDGKKPAFSRITCSTVEGQTWDRIKHRDKSKKTLASTPRAKGVRELNDLADHFVDSYNADIDIIFPVLAYFGTGRGVFKVPERKRGFRKNFTRFDAYNTALDSNANFKTFIEYFYALDALESDMHKQHRSFDFELPELAAIREAMSTFIPEFSNLRVAHPAGIMLDWTRDDAVFPLRIEQLSDGYRIALVMVMDIASRMAAANPLVGSPLEAPGIVLIDEIELHLHPGWQQRILLDLRRTFPNVQFIISTHSPQVISTVRPDQLRVIDWDGEKPKLLNISFSEGAASSSILDEILGVSQRSRDLPVVKDLLKYQEYVESGKWDSAEAKTLKRRIDAWGKGKDAEVDRLEMEVELQKLDTTS